MDIYKCLSLYITCSSTSKIAVLSWDHSETLRERTMHAYSRLFRSMHAMCSEICHSTKAIINQRQKCGAETRDLNLIGDVVFFIVSFLGGKGAVFQFSLIFNKNISAVYMLYTKQLSWSMIALKHLLADMFSTSMFYIRLSSTS